jgi:hypothetical protein
MACQAPYLLYCALAGGVPFTGAVSLIDQPPENWPEHSTQ